MPDAEPYAVLAGLYDLHKTIGAGGFSKVKSATHCLTGEKVAIKIMDKASLGEDLHRVKTEVSALREIRHQHICRLFQVIETEQKFFLVQEYCSGGELFDYIVRKDRLADSEARHFFRQILSALTYVHSLGYAHRDLKPENLLLSNDLQIKLIDFGLCAKPEGGIAFPLETCCGSPAYAAPELIAGFSYLGSEVDIWSLGVLLYALLCGFLPFEDDNLTIMYQKIQSGKYDEPEWLSDESKHILRRMLQTEPKQRAKVQDLLYHPWVIGDYTQPIKWRSIYDCLLIDESCSAVLAEYHQTDNESLKKQLLENKFDYNMATYLLLQQKKRRGKLLDLVFPPCGRPSTTPTTRRVIAQNTLDVPSSPISLLTSPTIHASLEKGLDQIKEEDYFSPRVLHNRVAPPVLNDQNAQTLESSYDEAVTANSVLDEAKPARVGRKGGHGPQRKGNKENLEPPKSVQLRRRTPPKVPNQNSVQDRPLSLYSTPVQRSTDGYPYNQNHYFNGTQSPYITPLGAQLRAKSLEKSLESSTEGELDQMDTPSSTSGRTPRSRKRGHLRVPPSSGRKVFSSLERGFDRMIKAMTPRRKIGGLSGPRHVKTVVNVSTTSTQCPEAVLHELTRIIRTKGIDCKLDGWTVCGKAKDAQGRVNLVLELEVVYCSQADLIGVRRKRLTGDAFMYKRICEDILQLAQL